jgi:hypothetical protein
MVHVILLVFQRFRLDKYYLEAIDHVSEGEEWILIRSASINLEMILDPLIGE